MIYQGKYIGPRRMTRREVAALSDMPAKEIRKLRDALARTNTDFNRVRQMTTIMHTRARYERAVPANNGRSTLDE